MGKSNPLNFMYEAPPGLAKGEIFIVLNSVIDHVKSCQLS